MFHLHEDVGGVVIRVEELSVGGRLLQLIGLTL